jgi:hypothetical protein
MAGHFAMWPPPWERNSPLRRAASFAWLIAMIPVGIFAVLVVAPVTILSKLTGWGAKARRTREGVCRTIEQFVDGGGGRWDWDDFTSVPDADALLEEVRRKCVAVSERFPPEDARHWCGPKGLDELRRIAQDLRGADG